MKSYSYLFLFYLIIPAGCARYQYMSVNSHLFQNDNKEFIRENDTVILKYSFSGQNFPLTLTIFNKLPQPVYIDLERTLLVVNNAQVNGPFYNDTQTSFIAPLSYTTLISNPLKDKFVKLDRQDSLIYHSSRNSLGRNYSFNEETTPLFFRVILALSPYENYSNPTFYDYSFWISDITQSYVNPNFSRYKQSNTFYIKKPTGFARVANWTGILAILIIGGAINGGE